MSACPRPSHYSCYDYIITIINNYHNDYIACPRPQSHQAKNLPGGTRQQWAGGRLPTKPETILKPFKSCKICCRSSHEQIVLTTSSSMRATWSQECSALAVPIFFICFYLLLVLTLCICFYWLLARSQSFNSFHLLLVQTFCICVNWLFRSQSWNRHVPGRLWGTSHS